MLRTPLGRLRLTGFFEGLSYLVLLLIAMPLKYFAGMPEAVKITGSLHGALFILFFIFVAEVTVRRSWWSLKFWGLAAVASVVPCGTFVFDRWLAHIEKGEATPPGTVEPQPDS